MDLERAILSLNSHAGSLATAFVDQRQYFVSEASVYRLLKARGLITSPAFILLKAADRFAQPTTAVNQLWQTDVTYLRVVGWGWFYLSTVLDDFSRYILAWKLCTTMTAADVTETLRLALNIHRPRGSSDIDTEGQLACKRANTPTKRFNAVSFITSCRFIEPLNVIAI